MGISSLISFLIFLSSSAFAARVSASCFIPSTPVVEDSSESWFVTVSTETRHSLPDRDIASEEDRKYCPQFKKNHPVRIPETKPANLPDDGSVWRVGSNRWTPERELEFGDWFEKNVDENFLIEHQISADCADLALVARAIFSRINHLPYQVVNGRDTYSFDTQAYAGLGTVRDWTEKNWADSYVRDFRFQKFLAEQKNAISSGNIAQSTYQKKILSCKRAKTLSEEIHSGALLLYRGHTGMIGKIDTTAPQYPLKEISSTEGNKVQELHAYTPLNIERTGTGLGLQGFRWPVNCSGSFALLPAKQMYDYDAKDEQEALTGLWGLGDVMEGLAPGERKKPDKKFIDEQIREISALIVRRLDLVAGAQRKLGRDPNVFKDSKSQAYDDYSTPQLDHVIFQKMQRLLETVFGSTTQESPHDRMTQDLGFSRADQATRDYLRLLFTKNRVILVEHGRRITYDQFFKALSAGTLSSNPGDSIDQRWGIGK